MDLRGTGGCLPVTATVASGATVAIPWSMSTTENVSPLPLAAGETVQHRNGCTGIVTRVDDWIIRIDFGPCAHDVTYAVREVWDFVVRA